MKHIFYVAIVLLLCVGHGQAAEELVVVKLQGNSAAFSPDGMRVVTVSGQDTVQVWDAESGKELLKLEEHETFGSSPPNFSPDGTKIVTTGGWSNIARIWDAESGKKLVELKGHTFVIHSANFSPDGEKIITASGDATARIWDAESGEELQRLQERETWAGWLSGNSNRRAFNSAAFSPDGKIIVTTHSNYIPKIWDAESGRALRTLEGHTNIVLFATFSHDGKKIVTASSDRTARIWNIESGDELLKLEGLTTRIVKSAAFSPDGKKVVTAGDDRSLRNKPVRIFDAESGKELQTLDGHTAPVNSASFSSDGKKIVTGSSDGIVCIWTLE